MAEEPTRQELVDRGRSVLARLEHGTRPPRTRPLHLGSVAGLDRYTAEALWGSVWTRPALDLETRTLITLGVLSSLQRLAQLRTYLNSARNIGIDVHRIEEVLIQCSVHVGFPATVNTLELFREVLEVRDDTPSAGTGSAPGGPEHTGGPEQTGEDLQAAGIALRTQLFGETEGQAADDGTAVEGATAHGGSAEAVLERIETRYVFGDVYRRPDLDLPTRVMCSIGMVVPSGDAEELARWIGAAHRVGLDEATVQEVILQVAYYTGFPAARKAMLVARQVAAANTTP